MTFQDAIISVVENFGKDILFKNTLLNIMSDYNAFDESKSFRIILKLLVSDGYLVQMSHVEDWELTSYKITTRFVDTTGIQRHQVEYVLNCIAFALGIVDAKQIYGKNDTIASENIECPFCKGKHNITAKFCESTGRRLTKACINKSCSEYNKYVLPPQTMFCPICGQSINEDSAQLSKTIINGHESVNLGLSVKWATCNVGANQAHEFGKFFAWGETESKRSYTRETSQIVGKRIGDISGIAQYDPARNCWGGSWRMPTKNELQELIDNCKWELVTQNNINGMKVTGPNGNYIFLPGAGQYEGHTHQYIGYGYYSSSTPFKSRYSKEDEDVDENWHLFFTKYGGQEVWGGFRELGYSVRPVSY